jgi:hypothetical protein
MPFYSLFQGGHRPYFIDFSAKDLFKDHTHEIHRPMSRSLRLVDPRIISKYKETLHQHMLQQRIFEKLDVLQEVSSVGTWTEHHTSPYLSLDDRITEAMLHAE